MKMKIYFLALALGLTGCSDFLKETSQDEVRPVTVEDLEQMLLGDGYGSMYEKFNIYYASEIFTDNIMSNGVRDAADREAHNKEKWLYMWDEHMFDDAGGGYNAQFWENPYKCVLGCNLVLDNLNDMEGDERHRESVRGEALTLRSWYYLHLVNFFGIAYNQGKPETDLGVPLKLNAIVNGEFFTRNTVSEVYAQIEKDLLEGNRLLTLHDYDRNYFRIDHLAAKAILSRMYLYMEDWDKALAYADSVLTVKSQLLDLNKIKWTPEPYFPNVYSDILPDEIIWKRTYDGSGYSPYSSDFIMPFSISINLGGLYGGGQKEYDTGELKDLRGHFYFIWSYNYYNTRLGVFKGDAGDYGRTHGIRTVELYLNRAEAYARKYIKEGNDDFRKKALADLNHLRQHRFSNAFTYENINCTDGQDLLEYCLLERQRELCGETNHRWCDLRRLGMTVMHSLRENIGNTEYSQDMTQYVLPIPKAVLDNNTDLVPNNLK